MSVEHVSKRIVERRCKIDLEWLLLLALLGLYRLVNILDLSYPPVFGTRPVLLQCLIEKPTTSKGTRDRGHFVLLL